MQKKANQKVGLFFVFIYFILRNLKKYTLIFSWIVLFLLTSLGLNKVLAQCTPCNDPAPMGIVDYNSARISILSGGVIEFNFLNINDYKNGITLTNKTVLGISICNCDSEFGADPVAGSSITGWDLYFDTDDAVIQGSNPANTLPLCFIEAEADVRAGMVGVLFNGRQPLNNEGLPPLPLASEDVAPLTIPDRFWTTDQLNISYYLAVPPTNADCDGIGQFFPLIDSPVSGDYYTVSVSFTLVPRCATCIDTSY
jgi:hypothetical protein